MDPALNQAVVQETSSSAISLVVQWLILHASKTRGPGSTPGQGIRELGSRKPRSVPPTPKKFKKRTRNLDSDKLGFQSQHHGSPYSEGFPGGTSGKEPAWQCRRRRRHGFNPWVRKLSWRTAQKPTPVFLPGESPWTEEPGWLQSMGSQRVKHN